LKQEISISQPQVITKYNKFMGGVDHLDWLVQNYRMGVRSKKWYFNFFTKCLDVALVNAWILHSTVAEKPTTLLSFRCYVTRSYLKLQSGSDPNSAGRPNVCLPT